VLDKVRKLRALSKSANANEAAAAARAADRLVQQYRIDEALIGRGDVERDLYPIETFTSGEVSWQLVLIVALSDDHGCVSFTGTLKSGQKLVWLVGRRTDMALVRSMYEWLRDEVERLAQEYADGQRAKLSRGEWMDGPLAAATESYRLGAVRGCVLAMRSGADELRAAIAGSEAQEAMVHLDGRVAEAESSLRDELGADLPDQQWDEPSVVEEAFDAGVERGRALGDVKRLSGGSAVGEPAADALVVVEEGRGG
jgi:hypothetical protein